MSTSGEKMRRKKLKQSKKFIGRHRGLHQPIIKDLFNTCHQTSISWKVRKEHKHVIHKLCSLNGTVNLWVFKKNFSKTTRLTSPTTGYITNVWTRYKRHGYATKLVHVIIERAKRLGIKKLTLWVRDTKEARSFWKTFGIGVKGIGTFGTIKL